jgi:hypothetical protein
MGWKPALPPDQQPAPPDHCQRQRVAASQEAAARALSHPASLPFSIRGIEHSPHNQLRESCPGGNSPGKVGKLVKESIR